MSNKGMRRGTSTYSKKRWERIAYKLWKGELSKAEDVHHTCRTKECIDPLHLEALAPDQHRLHH